SRTIPDVIARTASALTLTQIVKAGIDFLSKDAPDGFFFMVEGGAIDWQCHSNDAGSVIREVLEFDNAIGEAYKVYQQYADETRIGVPADHETGALGLGTGSYDLNLKAFSHQKVSEVQLARLLNQAHKANGGRLDWAEARQILADNFGFFKEIEITPEQEQRLKEALAHSYGSERELAESEYQKVVPLATEAKEILNSIALVGWGSGGHSASLVPVFAVGVGAERFAARTDNAAIPGIIATVAGYPQ
ncbi:MAG: alkaline phosphatase, partial [Muribaculaceae bacterium]|nr:alkaline phosphatase [Muribaculaceae bacterium]